VWSALPAGQRQRVEFAHSRHLVPADEDAGQLFGGSVTFIRAHALAARP
jgi:hypothetical protein